MQELILEVTAPLFYIANPDKRVYWGYLLVGLVFAALVLKLNKQTVTGLLKRSFSQRYWFNQSSKIDVIWLGINQIIKILFITPLVISQLGLSLVIYRLLTDYFGPGDFIQWPTWMVTTLFTISFFLFDDFSRFFMHFLYHKVPWLWRFHAIHHSAITLNPVTLYRVHTIEYLLNSTRSLLVTSIVSGVFLYSFNGSLGLGQIFGVYVFTLLFNLAGANLRHSHIWLSFNKFEHWFISPAQHQIHHSQAKQHLDKNFGSTLAIWDRCFATWCSSNNESVTRFGLYKQKNYRKISQQIFGLKR